MGAHDCSEMGSLGCPEQWVARAVLLRPPRPFSGLGLLERCAVWRNPIPHPPASSAGWQSQSQRRLRPPGASCTPLCRDTTHSPPACWSLAWVVSPGATAPTVTYSVPNTPTPVQNGDPPQPQTDTAPPPAPSPRAAWACEDTPGSVEHSVLLQA